MIQTIIILYLVFLVLYLITKGVSAVLYYFHKETECERLLREHQEETRRLIERHREMEVAPGRRVPKSRSDQIRIGRYL